MTQPAPLLDLHQFAPSVQPVQRLDRAAAVAIGYPVIDLAQYQAQVDLEQQIVEAGLAWLL